MFEFEKDKDLSPLTTLHLPAKARLYAEYTSAEQLLKISRTPEFLENTVFHIGGGSNLLFEGDFNGLMLHSGIKGIKEYRKGDGTVFVIAGAGEKWADLVDYCVDNGLSGMECMAGIPGEVGASPVQNVGAYGREASDVIFNVEVFDTFTRKVETIKGEACEFSYRYSKFKGVWKGRYYVLRVSFKLKESETAEHLGYSGLRNLPERLGHAPLLKEVRDEVIRLRNTKLPDPAVIGSAGSFFKNPIVRQGYYEKEVLLRNPSVPCYELPDNMRKIPAGWLIEHAGLKGARIGGAEVYPQNCLVIANNGNATAEDVKALAQKIRKEVNNRFAIELRQEVNDISTDIEITVLGSGTSKGIPEAGCDCDVCSSEDPRDKRGRASILVRTMGTNILIDASPDFREQALREGIRQVDAVLLTHSHYDHVGGIDDLRPYCLWGDIPVYLRKDVNDDLHRRIDYCFRNHLYPGVPKFDMRVIENFPFEVDGIRVEPIEVLHGSLPIYGYRIGKFAYVTDAKIIPEREKEKLYGLDTLIINALRYADHFSHLTIDEALALIRELNPRQAFITHMCHHAGKHADLEKNLPDNVYPVYDGMKIVIK